MIKPSFKKNIINLSSTLSNYLGAKSNIRQLKQLQRILNEKDYDNIVFMVFDGLGVYDINELTNKNNYYKNHIVDILSSTMPATTTNATISMLACKYPSQHLWLAWSLFLEEQQRVVELFLNKDYYTKEPTNHYSPNTDITAYIDKANTDRSLYAIVPAYCKNFSSEKTINANTIEELFEQLTKLSSSNDKKFIYAYCDEPDKTMHEFKVHSTETQSVFEKIQILLEKYVSQNKNTLVITTADHGHIDISEYVKIYEDTEIMDLLERPLCGENRFASFKIKNGKHKEFKKAFNRKYKQFFDLVSVDKLINSRIFGTTENKNEIKKLFGDYVAIGNSSFKILQFYKNQKLQKGHHAGASIEEMKVPLCIFKSDN